MDILENMRYTIKDTANRRSVTAYVSSIVAATRQCREMNEFQQVLRAWRQLDLALRVAIGEPKEGTTIKSFMDTSNPTGLTLLGYLTVGMTYTTHSLTIEGKPPFGQVIGLGISLALTYATATFPR